MHASNDHDLDVEIGPILPGSAYDGGPSGSPVDR